MKAAAAPPEHVIVLGVSWIGNGFEEIDIARWSADILGWTGVGASNTTRRAGIGLERKRLLHLDPMLPAVAEIVDIAEGFGIGQAHRQRDAFLRDHRLAHAPVRIGNAVAAASDLELVQVVVRPAHRRLDHVVQRGQRQGVRHHDPPPDGRLEPDQFNAQLKQARGTGAQHMDALRHLGCPPRFGTRINGHVPRQQFIDAVDWMLGNTTQDMAQVGFGIEAIALRCADQAIEGGSPLAASI